MTNPDPVRRRSAASQAAVRFIERYQAQVSQRLATGCRFEPSCSEYGRLAFERYGFFTALRKTIGRLGRCRPGYEGPVVDRP